MIVVSPFVLAVARFAGVSETPIKVSNPTPCYRNLNSHGKAAVLVIMSGVTVNPIIWLQSIKILSYLGLSWLWLRLAWLGLACLVLSYLILSYLISSSKPDPTLKILVSCRAVHTEKRHLEHVPDQQCIKISTVQAGCIHRLPAN